MTLTSAHSKRLNAHTSTAAVLLVAGLVYGYLSLQEGVGTVGQTGAGFFPLLVAVALVASAVAVLVEEWRGTSKNHFDTAATSGPDEDTEEPEAVYWGRLVGVLGASLAVPLLADTSGFIVTLSAAVAVIAKLMGMPGLLRPMALGVGFGAAAWLIFVYWLFVPLPAGVLGFA